MLLAGSCCSFDIVQLRTVVFRQSADDSILSSSDVLTACYLLHDFRLLGPTLRPSAPVCRCHRDSWTRGRLALAQEAVRCPPSLSVSFLILRLLIYARSIRQLSTNFSYEDLDLSCPDQFTMCGKMSPEEILTEHVVDIHKMEADFRDAFERNQSSSQSYGVNKYFSYQSPKQKRLSIYNWNPGPDVEKKMLAKSKLRESGISLPCRRRPNMLTTKFFVNGFT